MDLSLNIRKIIFILCALLCVMPFISPVMALILGLLLAQVLDRPYVELSHKATNALLKVAIVGLGFGMNFYTAIKVGAEGFWFTVVAVFGVLGLGYLLGRLLKIEFKIGFLIAAGTAICGGSAIAALSPVMRANENEISVSLGTVFILNALALFLFPAVGQLFHLSQGQFGLWCAIAIHDTSSVVAAAAKYGDEALQIATTVKLSRALWIVPITLGTSFCFNGAQTKVQFPYFIGLFVLAMLANTYIPFVQAIAPYLMALAKRGLALTLFLIGTSLSFEAVCRVGLKPFLQGVILWLGISALSLWAIIILV